MEGFGDIEALNEEALRLVNEIHPILAGHAPYVVGAALADLLATLLAGHFGGTPAKDKALREELLRMHLKMVGD